MKNKTVKNNVHLYKIAFGVVNIVYPEVIFPFTMP